MAKRKQSKALHTIIRKAKTLKREYPHRFDHLKKSQRWSRGYVRQASAIYAKEHHGKSPVGKPRKRATRKRVGRVESPMPVVGASRRRVTRRRAVSRPVRMAGTRRRAVGKKDTNTLLLLAAVGVGVYFLMKKSTTTYPTNLGLPPLTATNNAIRNQQAQNILAYAQAAGLAITAITSLINTLNRSSDSELQNIYDHVNTTGDVSVYV